MDQNSGRALTGWAHCAQSLWKIFTTRVNTRLMRLTFGSDIPGLIDRPQNQETFAALYVALVEAVRNWEPGFRILTFYVERVGADGQAIINISGNFYPYGHLGDYSVVEDATLRFLLVTDSTGTVTIGSPA